MCLIYHPGHSHTVISDWREFQEREIHNDEWKEADVLGRNR